MYIHSVFQKVMTIMVKSETFSICYCVNFFEIMNETFRDFNFFALAHLYIPM